MDKSYIVASSKAWHRPGFDDLHLREAGRWLWVSSPDELLRLAQKECDLRYIFFLHWSWHVPAELWTRYECVCFHMSDVPYGRGGSPLQNLIVAGHGNTKLTALRMVEEMDAGPVYVKRDMSLEGRAEDIYVLAGEISFEIIRWMIHNEPTAVPQQGAVFSFKRRTPMQSALPEGGNLQLIYDHIRMLDAPTYPQAFVEYGEFRIEFSNAQLLDDEVVSRVVIRKRRVE
jgi:methionyl-tRNA formyltransferase